MFNREYPLPKWVTNSPTRPSGRKPVWQKATAIVGFVFTLHALTALFFFELDILDVLSMPLFTLLLMTGAVLWVLILVWAVSERGKPRWVRAARAIAMIAGAAMSYNAPTIGAYSRVWWLKDTYRREARAALEAAAAGREFTSHVGWTIVDPRDDPPVRVAFTWFAAHGDWDGVIYDPTHRVESDGSSWNVSPLWGIHVWHLWGPWYRAFNAL